MKKQSKFIKILILVVLMFVVSQSTADITTDYYIQNDQASNIIKGKNNISTFYKEKVKWLLDEGYSVTSIILNLVDRGMTLADAVYYLTQAKPEKAEHYYATAKRLLPSLPGWACSTDAAMDHRYDKNLNVEQLTDKSSLEEVAAIYFDKSQRFLNDPDWQKGLGHISVPIDELIKLKKTEIKQVSSGDKNPVDSWWYLEEGARQSKIVAAGLYPKDRRIVIDKRHQDLVKLKAAGETHLPVIVMYNGKEQIPTSDVERVPNELFGGSGIENENIKYLDNDGEITASEVIRSFHKNGNKLAPTREWRINDRHLNVRVDELYDLFDLPQKEEVSPSTWNKAKLRLARDIAKPLHVSLYGGAEVDRWINDDVYVAVAKEQGIKRLPVVFFYHGDKRQACGMPTYCLDHVRKAAGLPPVNVPPKIPPPIVPPGKDPDPVSPS